MHVERVSEDYARPLVEASWSALLELAYCLGSYRHALVLVGGWVPYILLKDHGRSDVLFEHVGSIDIDLVVDPDQVDEREYATIEQIITDRGWARKVGRPFSFIRPVRSPVDGEVKDIKVDFLTTRPEELIGRDRVQEVQVDLQAFTSAPIALSHSMEVTLDGQLPDGGDLRTKIQMADVVGCIGMKGFALEGRYKEKDAYDIYSVVDHFGDGPREVAELVRPYAEDPLMAEALGFIDDKFSSPSAVGPKFVADFYTTEFGEARQRRVQRAYQVVRRFLQDARGGGEP
jgi:hypothetical protein